MIFTGEVLEALNEAKEAGVVVDLSGAGPVFPELSAQYIGSSSNMGSLMGLTKDAIKREFRYMGVPSSAYHTISARINEDVFSSSYTEALGKLLDWVDQGSEDSDYDDENGWY